MTVKVVKILGMVVLVGVTGCWGQTSVKRTPDCQVPFSFTANGSMPSLPNYGTGGVTGPALCTFWTLGYTNVGFSAISLVFQSAPAATSTTPGSWVTYAGTVVTGSNPNTSTTGAQSTFSNGTVAVPWVRMTLASSTGTGTVFGLLQGWTSGNDKSGGGGGGGSGTVTEVDTGCGLAGGPITTTGTLTMVYGTNIQSGVTTYAVVTGDCGKVVELSNVSSSIAATIPEAGSTGFLAGWWTAITCVTGSPVGCTLTPATSTINGGSSISIPSGTGVIVTADTAGNYNALGVESAQAVSSVFGQTGVVNIPVTTTDISTPSPPSGGNTVWYTKGGKLCSESPASVENCTGSGGTANQNIRSIGAAFDGGGTALSSGKTTYFTVPFACTIAAWNITADTGTVSFDVWKIATGTAIPTVANTIMTGGYLALASGTAVHSTTLTSFTTTTVSANDIFGINLEAISGATEVSLVMQCAAN